MFRSLVTGNRAVMKFGAPVHLIVSKVSANLGNSLAAVGVIRGQIWFIILACRAKASSPDEGCLVCGMSSGVHPGITSLSIGGEFSSSSRGSSFGKTERLFTSEVVCNPGQHSLLS